MSLFLTVKRHTMLHNILLNDDQLKLLVDILNQVQAVTVDVPQTIKPRKLTETEQSLIRIREYRAKKAAKKGKK